MAEVLTSNVSLFRTSERPRGGSQPAPVPADGTYRVLATLATGEHTYRVFADLIVSAGNAHLRLHRFDVSTGDDWLVERKINVQIPRPEIQPLEPKLGDAEYVLCFPVRLDQARVMALFGRSGPPAT